MDCVEKGKEQESQRRRERQVVGPRVKLEAELRQELEPKPEF